MSKDLFLHAHLDFVHENLDSVNDKREERFFKNILSMTKNYKSKCNLTLLADHYWTLRRNIPQAKYWIELFFEALSFR